MTFVTKEQNAANLRSAERKVRIDMGVDNQDGTSPTLTYEQRADYVQQLAAVILATPGSFAAATVATARNVAGHTYSPLADPSFSWSEFAQANVDNLVTAGGQVAGVGQGVLATLESFRWLIPLVVIGGILFVATRRAQKLAA